MVILQVLLEEQNVTRAARRLNLSQSALSKQLAKLREMLDDPLFQRTAYGLKPTAHAQQIAERLPNLLQGLSDLTQPPAFVPASSDRQFSFAMVESAYETLLTRFIGKALQQAPNVRFSSYVWTEHSLQALLMGQMDFGITGRDLTPQTGELFENLPRELVCQTLFTHQQVCLVRQGHPALLAMANDCWDLDFYLSQSHVQVRCEGNDWWALDYHLARSGQHRKLSVIVPDFYGASNICAYSDLIFTVPASFAKHAVDIYPLIELPLPLAFNPMAYVLLWHQRHRDDPGHQWVRQSLLVSAKMAQLTQDAPSPHQTRL
nr:LysR family transcriptional regulator [Shewanella sp. NIFS-20-20]